MNSSIRNTNRNDLMRSSQQRKLTFLLLFPLLLNFRLEVVNSSESISQEARWLQIKPLPRLILPTFKLLHCRLNCKLEEVEQQEEKEEHALIVILMCPLSMAEAAAADCWLFCNSRQGSDRLKNCVLCQMVICKGWMTAWRKRRGWWCPFACVRCLFIDWEGGIYLTTWSFSRHGAKNRSRLAFSKCVHATKGASCTSMTKKQERNKQTLVVFIRAVDPEYNADRDKLPFSLSSLQGIPTGLFTLFETSKSVSRRFWTT